MPLAYGHLGDGNMHFNVLPPPDLRGDDQIASLYRCEAIIFSHVDAADGSISAKHGIGSVKRRAFLDRTPSRNIDLLRRIKAAIDPNGTMSPGRIFD